MPPGNIELDNNNWAFSDTLSLDFKNDFIRETNIVQIIS